MDKAELIRHAIEKRRDHNLAIGNPLFAAMAEEDIELLSFIDSMQEEPKKCMYSKDNYTDEDRKVLCEICEEKCEFNKKEESVDEDFLSLVDKEARELWKEINSGNDFSIVDSFNQFYGICMQVAESTVEWQKNPQEPVSEDLEDAAYKFVMNNFGNPKEPLYKFDQRCFKAGAEWQKEQMMAKAIDAQCFGFQGDALFSFKLPADNYLIGSEVKVIIIKED